MITHLRYLILILSVSLVDIAFAAFSAFAVITPENEAEYPFLIQVKALAGDEERSRIRIVGTIGESRHAWLIVCKNYVNSSGQNFRKYFWYGEQDKNIERISRLNPGQTTLPESGKQMYEYVEVELPNEQMRRAYIYIDYPVEVRDGGYYYSIDLAYYLEGGLGKKSVIQWETR